MTFPLLDCVEIDILNLSRLFAKSCETGLPECGKLPHEAPGPHRRTIPLCGRRLTLIVS
jgi:hypothetical protein